jgi:hypothetical protein
MPEDFEKLAGRDDALRLWHLIPTSLPALEQTPQAVALRLTLTTMAGLIW